MSYVRSFVPRLRARRQLGLWLGGLLLWALLAPDGAQAAGTSDTSALLSSRVPPAALSEARPPAFALEANARDGRSWPEDNGAAPSPRPPTNLDLEPQVRWLPRVTLFTENDGGFIKPNDITDRYYTAGNAMSLTFRPQWADTIADRIYTDSDQRANAVGAFAGQLLFTPEDLKDPELIEDDRPYAGYLFGGMFWQSANERSLDHVRVEIAMLGSGALADRAQEWVHTVFDGDDPQGWQHQHPNELTIQGYYRRKGKVLDESFGIDGLPGAIEAIPEVGLALGTVHRHAEIGATLRYGINLPSDFGPARIDDLSGTDSEYHLGFGTYVFARGSARAVQHDTFIEGSDIRNTHGVRPERLVGRAEGGLRLYYQHDYWNVELGYSQTVLTPEFREQDGTHAYASVTLSMTMSF